LRADVTLKLPIAYLLDACLAVVVLAITPSVASEGTRAFDALGLALAALAALPLVARRRSPSAVLVLVGAASAALVWLGYVGGAAPGLLVACYSVAVSPFAGARGLRTGATVACLFLLHVVGLREATAAGYPGAPAFPLLWAGAWLVGDRVRQRRRIAELEAPGSRSA
jgi:hypothetical protein